ncbi:GNAT family N-acetyltransferase [Pseudanabaena galeata UHCC 0370]|uniref:GNAT family N-acetyltransferase n=1 Tax=Pseudanabaena galeata UHCC 0370 TaxID=3110310 RepID=A0ABU5TFR4_9CYAN|nr:GNAT family N-acetyltransferase [Pseudanabaena galeata]MEA5477099.1 GNAT family N-acetyltransferase [Pseudanabaena galeata UHCC 0370]
MKNKGVYIKAIKGNSAYADQVKALGKANSSTLSLFPEGAFDDYIWKGNVLVALDENDAFLGYLLYTVKKKERRIRIYHLCLKEESQGKGIARQLIEHIKNITREFIDIHLICRQDYGIDGMWEKFGFIPIHEKSGKNKLGKRVTTWVYNHGHPDLFSANVSTKTFVVLDSSVFFDFYQISLLQDLDDRESAYLLADWIQEELELCTTDEIYNEINKLSLAKERDKMRSFAADKFFKIPCNPNKFENIYESLKSSLLVNTIFPIKDINIRQIARTIASGKSTFIVTTDVNLLSYANQVREEHGVLLVSPTELIVKLDELRRESEYQPENLAGTQLLKKRVAAEEKQILIESFTLDGEVDFKIKFSQLLIENDKYECIAVWDGNTPVALIVYSRENKYELSVPILRVSYKSLSETLTRHIIWRTINVAVSEGRNFTKITESQIDDFIIRVIQDAGFYNVDGNWIKINSKITKSTIEVSEHLINISLDLTDEYKSICRRFSDNLTSNERGNPAFMFDLEKLLYPTKIVDTSIPNFVIPIKPHWAKELFDEELAKESLFGVSRSELALNWESVYYRSTKSTPVNFAYPARILWYVSSDKDGAYTSKKSKICACSTLDEVAIGNPEELYLKFRRLGIFKWEDIKSISKSEIMAIRFSNTEIFKSPISLDKIHELLASKANIQSPRLVTNEVFFEIYSLGNTI